MTRIIVEVPDDGPDVVWAVARAVLEDAETGSSKHCLRVEWAESGMVGFTHVRLGIRVALEN